jgi:hypothetical protein
MAALAGVAVGATGGGLVGNAGMPPGASLVVIGRCSVIVFSLG